MGEAYLEECFHKGLCPSCTSTNISYDGYFESECMKVGCDNCGAVWFEVYEFKELEIIEKGRVVE